jgi:uncharacterized protein YkwD
VKTETDHAPADAERRRATTLPRLPWGRSILLSAALLGGALGSGAAARSGAATLPPLAHAAAKPAVFGPAVLRELNRVRARYHLHPVASDGRMSRGALEHSRDMARHHYFAHGAWSGRVDRAAGQAKSIGEVLGWLGRTSADSEARWLVKSWLASPPHRVVLLDGRFRRVGIGRAAAQFGSTAAAVYTVDFATNG